MKIVKDNNIDSIRKVPIMDLEPGQVFNYQNRTFMILPKPNPVIRVVYPKGSIPVINMDTNEFTHFSYDWTGYDLCDSELHVKRLS